VLKTLNYCYKLCIMTFYASDYHLLSTKKCILHWIICYTGKFQGHKGMQGMRTIFMYTMFYRIVIQYTVFTQIKNFLCKNRQIKIINFFQKHNKRKLIFKTFLDILNKLTIIINFKIYLMYSILIKCWYLSLMFHNEIIPSNFLPNGKTSTPKYIQYIKVRSSQKNFTISCTNFFRAGITIMSVIILKKQ